MDGEDVDLCSGDQAWQVDAGTPAEAVFDAYRAETRRSDAVIWIIISTNLKRLTCIWDSGLPNATRWRA